MMMLNLFFFGKESLPPDHLPRRVSAHLPHDGDGGQESEPWAKEANPLFSQRPYKAGYGESFKRSTGCGQARIRGEPASLMQLGHHARPGDAGLCKGTGL